MRKEDVRSISRRYFISNGFDGTLTSIGIAIGSFLSGVPNGITVFKIGVGAAIGLSTSGVWSVWEIERAEKRAKRRQIERAMLRDLEATRMHREQRGARVINASLSGLGPLIGVLLPITPFLFVDTSLTLFAATVLAVAIGVALLFVFGAYMGSISDQNWYVAGVRMALAGVIVALLNFVLPG
ncbi:VIT1/CCC1 transporter family protein [Haladaptatus sp. W1]|uniref:VIT1/CCC1 transporter family protein n=1 Tax=Haladaptatus sp. W1 TaxID=1897478 RepID=UPI0020C7CF7E|nr:VIT1/CCC1 transporter family protein [Haladaptatus sp. W1]